MQLNAGLPSSPKQECHGYAAGSRTVKFIIATRTSLRRAIERLRSQVAASPARAQTMTEYALILAAIAIVVYVTYQTLGTDIGVLVNKVDTVLTSAAS